MIKPVPALRGMFFAWTLGLLTGVSPVHADVDIFVSPTGNDAGSGAPDQPFATLARAQTLVRSHAGQEPVRVHLHGGTYYLGQPLVFTAADGGTATAPITYAAEPGEEPVLSGGVKLELNWQPYRDGILQAKVPTGLATDQLFVNGERQMLARYPNYQPNEAIFNGYAADAFSPERAARWSDPAGGFMHALHNSSWGGYSWLITGKNADGTLAREGGWQMNRAGSAHKKYRFVENIFEELDSPGEWFLNAKTGALYFYPPAGLDLSHATVEAVQLRSLVEFHGSAAAPVRFVTLQGLTFRHAARTFMDNKEPLVRSDWTVYRGGAIFFNGATDCTLADCFLDQVGGNAVFVNDYNRRITVRGCHIAGAGANGVAFVGDPAAARVPQNWQDHSQTAANLDRTPGPKTDNYPADCLVADCLIHNTGRFEKQTAPVEIDLAQSITVRHCSLYDVPRAGINIGDGCWGGHVIEFCDIFDTVRETGDHGSFNSWGRDRYWQAAFLKLNTEDGWAAYHDVPLLDAVKPNILRNNRWRCDHGWDIDLDDGSSNYEIRNNLCLHGGIKNREGFQRVVENNVIVNNTYFPQVWYRHGGDIFRHNIISLPRYAPAIMHAAPWGADMDDNLVNVPGQAEPVPAEHLAVQSGRDAHSLMGDAQFVDAAHGDFRVKDGSPALKLGFVNFPMDQFGVQSPKLKALARTPEIPAIEAPVAGNAAEAAIHTGTFAGATIRNISGLGDRSAYGLPDETGVLLLTVPAGALAAAAGLAKDDVIVAANGKPVATMDALQPVQAAALALTIMRNQKTLTVTVPTSGAEPDAATTAIPGAHLDYAPGKAPQFWSMALADTIMARWPDFTKAYFNGWTYVNGYALRGFEMLYQSTGDKKYFDYTKRYLDQFVDANGNFLSVITAKGTTNRPSFGNIDNMMTGNALVMMYEQTHDERYKIAATKIRRALDTYPRNSDGGFWHNQRMNGQMWIDGVFMGEMFVSRYGKSIGDTAYCWDEVTRQLTVFASRAQAGNSGLYLHGYFEGGHGGNVPKWANPQTGLSPEVWSEGLGWYALMLAETLADLPKDHPQRAAVEDIFRRLAAGLKRVQDPKTGRWFQVVDKGGEPDNWTDNSGSAMFTYMLQAGITLGLLDKTEYAPVVARGYQGIIANARINDHGLVDISSACDGVGVQVDYAHYINFKKSMNAKEAVAGFLWATAIVEQPELEKLKKP